MVCPGAGRLIGIDPDEQRALSLSANLKTAKNAQSK
jgi:hypothetical protein